MSPWEVYAEILKFHRSCPDVEAIFIAGGCFRTLEMLATLEKDTGLPVVATVPARLLALPEDSRGEGPRLRLWSTLGETEVSPPAPATGADFRMEAGALYRFGL